ncbi:MAG TPA: hypothetical protein ENN60_03105 [archaeon]|nr:hypothetical protein [archaeon]
MNLEREVYHEEKLAVIVELEAGRLKVIDASADSGYGVRLGQDGKLGFGFAKTEKKAENLAGKAMVRKFDGFPGQPERKGQEVCHDIAEAMNPEVLAKRVQEMAGVLGAPTSVAAFASVVKRHIWNSNGLDLTEKQSWVGYQAYTARDGSEGWESWEGRQDEKEAWMKTARTAEDWCRKWQGAVPEGGEIKNLPMVLSARAISSLMGVLLLPNLSGSRALHGQTLLRVGEPVENAGLKLIHKPDLHQSAFDGEGMVPRKFTVFDGGLKTYLHTWDTAREMGGSAEPTATAARSWQTYPDVYPQDLEVKAPKSELSDSDSFVFVNDLSGVHTVDPLSGRFMVEAHQAFVMPDWQPVQPFMLSGTLGQLLAGRTFMKPEARGNFWLPALEITPQ